MLNRISCKPGWILCDSEPDWVTYDSKLQDGTYLFIGDKDDVNLRAFAIRGSDGALFRGAIAKHPAHTNIRFKDIRWLDKPKRWDVPASQCTRPSDAIRNLVRHP